MASFLCVCVHARARARVHMHAHTRAHTCVFHDTMWMSENNLQKLVLLFHHVDSRGWTRVTSLDSKHFNLQNRFWWLSWCHAYLLPHLSSYTSALLHLFSSVISELLHKWRLAFISLAQFFGGFLSNIFHSLRIYLDHIQPELPVSLPEAPWYSPPTSQQLPPLLPFSSAMQLAWAWMWNNPVKQEQPPKRKVTPNPAATRC